MTWVHRLTAASLVVAASLAQSAVRCQEPGVVPPGPTAAPPSTASARPASAQGPDGPGKCDGQGCYPGAYGAGPNASKCNKHPMFYCPARYWTPALARAYDWACGPKLSVYAVDCSPGVPPTFLIQRYHCVTVDPWATIIERPLAPETSQARYILGPR